MAQLPLGPVPNTQIAKNPTDDAIWHRWFEDLRKRLVLPQQIFHNLLGGLQGGTTDEYYHLTSSQHTTVTGNKSANTVFAGPTSGAAAAPTFRALVAADIPGVGTSLKILYHDETLTIATNTQITGHTSLSFTGTGNLIIDGTGSLSI